MNVVFVIVDSLRLDYFYDTRLYKRLQGHTCKCLSAFPTTSEALPILLTGKNNPIKEVVGKRELKEGWMWITEIASPTMFDWFEKLGYNVHYISLDPRNDSFYDNCMPSFFPSLPSGKTINEFLRQDVAPFFLMLHVWTVHYPYGLQISDRNKMLQEYSVKEIQEAYRASVVKFGEEILPKIMSLCGRDTLLVVTADHGENLGEDGRFFHSPPANKWLTEVPLFSSERLTSRDVVEQCEVFGLIQKWFGE